MGTQEQVDWMIAQAEKLQVVADAEQRATLAKEAYRANPGDEAAKAEHHDASANLNMARQNARATTIVDPAEGDAVVVLGQEG